MSKYYNVYQETGERFYRLPKVFFTSELYKKIRNDTKIAYAILQDRVELSIKNGWIDKDGNVFFIYTNEELQEILNASKTHIIKIKKELESVNLLEQKRRGLNKPNMLYLLKPIATEDDVYLIRNQDDYNHSSERNDQFKPSKPSNDTEVQNKHFQKSKINTSRSSNLTPLEVHQNHTNDTELSDTDFSDIELNDTDNTNNTSHADNAPSNNNKNWVKDHQKDKILNKYPKGITVHLNSLPTQEAKEVLSVLNKAKKNVTEGIGAKLIGNFDFTHEYHQDQLGNIIRRVLNEAKMNNKSIKAYSPYLMKSFLNYYAEYWEPIMDEIVAEDMQEFSGFQ